MTRNSTLLRGAPTSGGAMTPGGLVKTDPWVPVPSVWNSGGLGGARTCTSTKFPCDADAAGPGNIL